MMANTHIACPTVMRIHFSYEAKTGKIYKKSKKHKEGYQVLAFESTHVDGYLRGGFRKKQARAHRVAWCLAYGAWPDGQIDHINGDRSDNRLHNLRLVTNQENSRNQKKRKTNKSGAMGVCWHKASSKWIAQIMRDGKRVHLGVFSKKSDALEARRKAEIEADYHANHGKR